jgi:hypothetical protein
VRFAHMPFWRVMRNDLVYAVGNVGETVGTWNRVVAIDNEPGHPVKLTLADGTSLVGGASEMVSVRRLRIIQGGQ